MHGHEHVVISLIISMLSNANLLLEGSSGSAKIRSIKTVANLLHTDLESHPV
jgi:MoxR-like ATPase